MGDATPTLDRSPRRRSPAGAVVALIAVVGCASPSSSPSPAGTHTARRPAAQRETGREATDLVGESSRAESPAHTGPVLPPVALAAREAAQQRVLGEAPFGPDYFANPRMLTESAREPTDATPSSGPHEPELLANGPSIDAHSLGRYVALRGAGDAALSGFHQALGELESGERTGKVRVAFYGSSQTSADFITGYLRTYLQHRFGDGGHGFVALAKPWRTYRHLDVGLETTKGWHTDHAQKSDRREDGYYGLLGASTSAKRRGQKTTIFARGAAVATKFELAFLEQPQGGSFLLDVDGKHHTKIKTRAKEPAPGYYAFELEPGLHQLRVRVKGDGEVRLFGAVLENDQPGVVLDTLGINGARAANQLTWDETVWADAFLRRSPSLVVLAYGGNESTDADVPISVYASELEQVVARYRRIVPEASCLLMGPGDFPEETPDGGRQPRARLRDIVRVQEDVARRHGCAFWDTQAFMGGELGMLNWVAAVPAMARPDHLHLTRRGYMRMGMALADALMQGYDAPSR